MQTRRYADLHSLLAVYREAGDLDSWLYIQRLIATADGRYDFRSANLNEAVSRSDAVDVQPMGFRQWLQAQWATGAS